METLFYIATRFQIEISKEFWNFIFGINILKFTSGELPAFAVAILYKVNVI